MNTRNNVCICLCVFEYFSVKTALEISDNTHYIYQYNNTCSNIYALYFQ